jgi:DNA-binding PadR family transcriptional regulator
MVAPTILNDLILQLRERPRSTPLQLIGALPHLQKDSIRQALKRARENGWMDKEGKHYFLTQKGMERAAEMRPVVVKKLPPSDDGPVDASSDDPYDILRFMLAYRRDKGKAKVDKAFEFAKSIDP